MPLILHVINVDRQTQGRRSHHVGISTVLSVAVMMMQKTLLLAAAPPEISAPSRPPPLTLQRDSNAVRGWTMAQLDGED